MKAQIPKSDAIMLEMQMVARVHGICCGQYRRLKALWFVEVDKEYSRLCAITDREGRERLLDADYARKIKTMRGIAKRLKDQ